MAARKAKFGTTAPTDKLSARKARFGMTGGDDEKNKLSARAQRFGTGGADPSSLLSDEKKRKRMEKFGVVDPDAQAQKRQKRFGMGSSVLPALPSGKGNAKL